MEIALLGLRVVTGLLFAGHGAQKLFGWFGGSGPEGTGAFFEQKLGLRPGKLHATAAGFNEFAGGLLLAAGFLTPLAAALMVATMTAAIITVHAKNGPWVTDQGWELNVLYAAIGVAVAGIGPGELSLDHALGLDISGLAWAGGALAAGLVGGVTVVTAGRRAASGGSQASAASS